MSFGGCYAPPEIKDFDLLREEVLRRDGFRPPQRGGLVRLKKEVFAKQRLLKTAAYCDMVGENGIILKVFPNIFRYYNTPQTAQIRHLHVFRLFYDLPVFCANFTQTCKKRVRKKGGSSALLYQSYNPALSFAANMRSISIVSPSRPLSSPTSTPLSMSF